MFEDILSHAFETHDRWSVQAGDALGLPAGWTEDTARGRARAEEGHLRQPGPDGGRRHPHTSGKPAPFHPSHIYTHIHGKAQFELTGSEAYERASARSGTAGTIGLMLKSYETWGAEEGIWRAWCGARLPQGPRW